MLNTLAIILHLVAINIWVGGMFFIIVVLGRVVKGMPMDEQHRFWQQTLARFFAWVWLALLALLGSGLGMGLLRFNGLGNAPPYVWAMAGLGLCMASVFLVIYLVFYQRFKRAMQQQQAEQAHAQLRWIRRLGILNMLLGFGVVLVIGGGPWLFY